MATRRTEIVISVLGLQDLQAANSALNTHVRAIQRLTSAYQALNAATGQLAGGITTINNDMRTFNVTTANVTNNINNIKNSLGNANTSGRNFLGTMLQYRAVSLVFEGVTKAIGATVQALYDMEKQAARVQRVSPAGSTPSIRADFAVEASRTGADIKDIGEAYYQLKTQISDNTTAFNALQVAMNLVVGTESDAREVTRAMLQVYNQFGAELGTNVDQSEKLRRSGELLAIMWKGSAAEISEITSALKYLGPVAESAHVPLEQVAATLSALTFEGVRGRMGGTEAAQLIGQLLKNFNLATGFIENKGAKVKIEFTSEGGVDLIKTIENINRVASSLPTEESKKFTQAIAGTMNAWRLLGTTNPDFMRILHEKLGDATKATHGLTSETDRLRQTMTTTAQEWQRVWGGTITAISNMLQASGIRDWFHGIGDELQRINTISQGMAATADRTRTLLTGGGLFPGDPHAQQLQVMQQRDLLKEMLNEARARGVRGGETFSELGIGGEVGLSGAARLFEEVYKEHAAADKGYLQRFMSFTPSRNPVAGILTNDSDRDVSFNIQAMQAEYDRLTQQLRGMRPGAPGTLGPVAIAQSVRGGLPTFTTGVPGGYTDPKVAQAKEEAEKAADEQRRKRIEKVQDDLSKAKADYTIKLEQLGAANQKTIGASQYVDVVTSMLAKLQNDEATLMMNRAGVGTQFAQNREKIQDDQKKKQEETAQQLKEAQKQRADMLEYYAENAITKYGPFSDMAKKRAEEAQAAAETAARNDTDFLGLQKLLDRSEGPIKKNRDAQKEFWEKQADGIKSALDSASESQSYLISEIIGSGERKLRGIQRGARPNLITGDAEARQLGVLQNTISTIETIIERIRKNSDGSEATNKELETMKDRLADANAALVDFNDRLQAQAYQRRIKAEEDAYQLRADDISHLHKLRFAKDDEGAYRNKVSELSQLLANAQGYVEIVRSDTNVSQEHFDRLQQAAKQRDLAQQNLSDYQIDAKIQRYLNVYQNVRGTVHDLLSGFLHGQGDLGTVAQGLGGTIVQASFDQFIKKYTDPLVSTITGEILAIQGNTDALGVLTSTMTGGGLGGSPASSPFAASVAAGVQQGMQDFGWGPVGDGSGAKSSKKPGQPQGLSDFQKGTTAALAAYSIGATSAQQGVNAGNFLGGILSGASIGASFGPGGGLIGGIVGGAVDLIGGLFHHKSKPTDTPQNLNPALYNAPSGFDLGAYNYSAYGKLPTLQNVGFEVKPITPPTFNIYIDGAKREAQIEINRQATSVNVSLGNSVRDRYSPL